MEELYALRGQPVPPIAPVKPREMPQPQRSLLAHQNDMTSTLEQFYQKKLHVEVLARRAVESEYFREVSLRLGQDGQRVEYGAIKIMLDLLPVEVRQEILRERQPLGRILTESGVYFASRPRFYLRVTSDDFVNGALGLSVPQLLYGRRNTLVDARERPLAEIVEILPPGGSSE